MLVTCDKRSIASLIPPTNIGRGGLRTTILKKFAKRGDAKPRQTVDKFPTDRNDIQLFQNSSGLRQIFYLSMLQTPSVTIA